jgi:Flp pilus assembly protein TadD
MNPWIDHLLQTAMTAYQGKQYDTADATLRLVLGRSGVDAYVLYFIGHLAYLQGRLPDAIWFLGRSAEIDPNHARAQNDLGEALRAQGDNTAAITHLRRAIELNPTLAYAYGNMATALLALDRPEEAQRYAQESLRRGVDKTVAHCDLGTIFARLNRPAEALRQFELALSLNPDNVRARYNRGLVRLSLGQMPGAWADHEARLDLPPVVSGTRRLAAPRWKGEPIAGRTILLHPEQGLGDTIQFLRYVPMVQATGAKIILEVPPGMKALCRFQGVTLIQTGDDLPAYDVHAALMSLPAIFQTTLETIPASVPYLHQDAASSSAWASRLGPWNRMRVGIAWSGSGADVSRSLPLATLAPLLNRPDIECHVVQRDIRPTDDLSAFPDLIDHHGTLKNFGITAGLLANMDLVVTVDTVIAHLAGALNIPAWVMLAHSPDWRWLRDREDTPWYPSLRLFRQKSRGNWASVLDAIATNLDAWSIRRS